MKVLVAGGTGFVGRAIVHALRARELDVRVLARGSDEDASHFASLGVELQRGDLTRPETLGPAVEGCTHVVNLVAILKGSPSDFRRVMIEGNAALLAAARESGVERYVLMSALGTTERTKDLVPYFGAKWAMERAAESSGLEYTIVRPSFVFGRGGALPTFVRQVKLSPVVMVLGPGTQRIQPIWLEDVAQFYATIVDDPRAAGRIWEIGGPDIVTWNELYLTIAKVLGKRRRLIHVPFAAARAGARLTQWAPGAPVTVDQIAMIEAGDNVCSNTDAKDTFQLPLVTLEDQLRRAA
jgi:NADH dehydrogenase